MDNWISLSTRCVRSTMKNMHNCKYCIQSVNWNCLLSILPVPINWTDNNCMRFACYHRPLKHGSLQIALAIFLPVSKNITKCYCPNCEFSEWLNRFAWTSLPISALDWKKKKQDNWSMPYNDADEHCWRDYHLPWSVQIVRKAYKSEFHSSTFRKTLCICARNILQYPTTTKTQEKMNGLVDHLLIWSIFHSSY